MNATDPGIATRLRDSRLCPRCVVVLRDSGGCWNCGVDLRGPLAEQVWTASQRAAEAFEARQRLVAQLPSFAPVVAPASVATWAPSPVAAPGGAAPARASVPPPLAPAASSQVSVQSVLAVAGASLFAVAAIVFTFLNPELTDFGTRTAIVGAVTALFLGSAVLLARRRLQLSAEVVGALGMVFLALDVWAFTQGVPGTIPPWVSAALATALVGAAMATAGVLIRVRTWLWTALLALALVPAFLGYATGDAWGVLLGHLGVATAGLGLHALIGRLRPRLGSPLLADRVTVTAVQLLAVTAVLIQLPSVGDGGLPGVVVLRAGVLLALGLVAAGCTRTLIPGVWSAAAGLLLVAAGGLAALALPSVDPSWQLALAPAGAAVVVVALAGAPLPRTIGRAPLLAGGVAVLIAAAVPASAVVGSQLVTVPTGLLRPVELPGITTLAGMAGAGALAGGLWAAGRLRVRHRGFEIAAWWVAALVVVAAPVWTGLDVPARAIGSILLALVAAAALRVRRLPTASSAAIAPVIAVGHLAVVLAALLGSSSAELIVPVGAATAVALLAVAQTVPAALRPLHLGAGYAYALVIIGVGLGQLGLDPIAVLCLVTSIASAAALAATLVRRLRLASWYVVLGVTAVPFLIGIASVLLVRSGWTALSTAVTFALALTLVLTRRPGLGRAVRAAAAGLLVPALAVVVICLGAQLLDVSASPVTLPVIAVLVAAVLPIRGLLTGILIRRRLGSAHVGAVRGAVELSALITGVLAVVLALVRTAAGLPTTFVVLLILGIGAAAAARAAGRRWGWWTAAAAWTGALWCQLALAGVAFVEPYVLPPALSAVVIGMLAVGRRRSGVPLYATGLACAVLPSLVILAVVGSGPDAITAWRAWALLAAAALLLVVAAVTGARRGPLRAVRYDALRAPTLLLAIAAAGAGALQAVRWGAGADVLAIRDPQQWMWPVLGVSLVAVLLASVAGAMLGRGPSAVGATSRWRYAAATVFLVAGPIAAIRPGWLPIWMLWTLAVVLLVVMVVSVQRARSRTVTLPPTWFLFAVAWCTAVAGWSERELRVEAFSLPLGLALLAAGILSRADTPAVLARAGRARLDEWPHGVRGSWNVLAPGIVVTLLPSLLATGTDPRTERAVLVIALALVAVLLGSLRRLAAPFVLGIAALPIENAIVFAVQLGRGIDAASWWITLATAGAVLLVIAVSYERRTGGDGGVTARLRDLR